MAREVCGATPMFWRFLWNSFVFIFLSQLLLMVLGTILAEALNWKFRGKSLVCFLILLHWAGPTLVAFLGWLWISDSTFSLVLEAIGWLGPGQIASIAIAITLSGVLWTIAEVV